MLVSGFGLIEENVFYEQGNVILAFLDVKSVAYAFE